MSDQVLLTGAAGLVGAEVAVRLERAGRPVVAVLHAACDLALGDGTTVSVTDRVAGDVREPGLGFDQQTLARLGRDVGLIVHCAATTAFDATDEQYRRLNVDGTRHALDLARCWQVPFLHVSTAYVCGLRGGTIAEDELDAGQRFGNGYERSKFAAEQLVEQAAAEGLPVATVRPGIVAGAHDDGVIRDYKNLYTVVKLMVEGKLRMLPGRYDATLSLAPVDHVADVVAEVARRLPDGVAGRCFHALGSHPLTLRELSDVLAEYPSFEVATFVPESAFDAQALDPIEREYYRRVGSLYTSYFARRLAFATDNADALLGRPAPECGPDYLRLLLDHCLDSGYLGAPLPSVQQILARMGASR
ncbi:hypothetical protein GCM10009624_09530 [Gordonia sinesedis]